MKAIIFSTLVLGAAITAGTIFYLHKPQAPTALPPVVVDSAPAPTPLETIAAPKREPAKPVAAPAPTPVPITNAAVAAESEADDASTALARDIDTLVSKDTSYGDRQALLAKLKASGQLDQVVAQLQQMAAANTNDAETLVALGEASLKKFPLQDYDQSGILALQVDQAFSAALKIDPSNWEAEYFKADSLSFWPTEMNKGPQVIQQLSNLIDQQETMTPQPQFAQSYVLLGDQYQKAGQADYAAATWKLGLAAFPSDSVLQLRTASQ